MSWLLPEFEPQLIPADQISTAAGKQLWQQFDQNGRRLQVEFPGIPTNQQWRLTNLGYAGQVGLPGGPQFQLQPKVPVQNLFSLIDTAFNLQSFRWLDGWAKCDTIEAYFDRLALYLANRIARRRRQGLYQAYETRHDDLQFMRGRLDLPRLLAHPQHQTVPCDYAEASHDNADNQILVWTLHLLLRSGLPGHNTQQQLKRTLRSLDGIGIHSFTPRQCRRRLYHRLNQDYERLHLLCALFLEGLGPAEVGGQQLLPAFIVNMAELFERFIFRWLDAELKAPYQLNAQESVYLDDFGRHRFELDLVLRQQGEIQAVLDTKYKHPTGGPSTNDIAQVIAYAQAVGSPRAYLIYPTPLPQPLVTTIGSVDLKTVHFDLAQPLSRGASEFLSQLAL